MVKNKKYFQISGREMFEFNPDLVAGDDDEAGDDVYERETDNDEMEALGNVRGSGAD